MDDRLGSIELEFGGVGRLGMELVVERFVSDVAVEDGDGQTVGGVGTVEPVGPVPSPAEGRWDEMGFGL